MLKVFLFVCVSKVFSPLSFSIQFFGVLLLCVWQMSSSPIEIRERTSGKSVNSAELTPPEVLRKISSVAFKLFGVIGFRFCECVSLYFVSTCNKCHHTAPLNRSALFYKCVHKIKRSQHNICICNLNADNSYLDC